MKVPKSLLFQQPPQQPPRKPDRATTSTPDTPPSGGGCHEREKAPDGRLTASENAVKVLRVIERIGHATSQQIAWMSGLNRRSVQRVLKRLNKQKMVSSARLPNGDPVYMMRQAGADELSIQLHREVRRTNDDQRFIESRIWKHRKLANDAAAELSQHYGVYTEREIQRGKVPGGRREILPGKVPDMMLERATNEWIWVEVERSWKKRSDYMRLIKTLEIIAAGKSIPFGEGQIVGTGILVESYQQARLHVSRLLKHFNRDDPDDIPEHLIGLFNAVSIMWFDEDGYRESSIIHFT